MPAKSKQESFSFQINMFIKIIFLLLIVLVINGKSLILAGITSLGVFSLLIKGNLRQSWLKILSKLSYFLIAYLVLDLIFTNDIESSLIFIGKLFTYLVLLVWIKESSSLESYLSDVYTLTFVFGIKPLAKKIDSFFHYFNFYLIATMKLIIKFGRNYNRLFPGRSSFVSLFIQVFLDTLMSIPIIKNETNEQLRIINYRPFNLRANSMIIILGLVLGFFQWSNCEILCKNFLLK